MVGILATALATAAIGSGSTGGMIAALLLLGIDWSFSNVAGSALFASTAADETHASAQGAADALSTSSEPPPPSWPTRSSRRRASITWVRRNMASV